MLADPQSVSTTKQVHFGTSDAVKAHSTKAVKESAQTIEKRRAAAEKVKIKAQYESFMSLKKQAEDHPDHQTAQQYSALNDDIQSLLTSLQSTKK